jgi:hypothetical protein
MLYFLLVPFLQVLQLIFSFLVLFFTSLKICLIHKLIECDHISNRHETDLQRSFFTFQMLIESLHEKSALIQLFKEFSVIMEPNVSLLSSDTHCWTFILTLCF